MPDSELLRLEQLKVQFNSRAGLIHAVRGVSFSLEAGETLAVVGESGAGKSQIFHALMGLLSRNGQALGKAYFHGKNLLQLTPAQLNRIRGQQISMIFQDPMTALNPYLTIERQLTEVLELHRGYSHPAATQAALEMLEQVWIPQAKTQLKRYPHELSGGMRQRVMIAMSLLCKPDLLIADEPTTALDVTVQAEIMALLQAMHSQQQMAIVLITHDLPLIAGLCQRVIVMYAGKIVEQGTVEQIFYQTSHPYTQQLLAATPQRQQNKGDKLHTIQGQAPDPRNLPSGCPFHPRCPKAQAQCQKSYPETVYLADKHSVACHLIL